MADVAWRGDGTDDPTQADQGVLSTKNLLQLVRGLDPILEGKHFGPGRKERTYRLCGVQHLPCLDAEDDRVDHSNIRWVVPDLCRVDDKIALRTGDVQSISAHCFYVCTTSDESNGITGARQHSTKISPHPACPENRKPCVFDNH